MENEACEYILMDKFVSAFNIEAIEVIKSNHFRKVAFTHSLPEHTVGEVPENLYANDIVKCRRNLLLYAGYDFARYSVLDNIEPFNGELTTGFYYVETLNTYPLRGNGFYSLPMIEYALQNKMIKKQDIKYQFKPSLTIKHDEFRELVDYILNAFKTHPKTGKLAINSSIGLYGRRNGSFVESRLCERNNLDDIGNAYEQLNKPFCIDLTPDVVAVNSPRKIEKLELHYPIHAQILDCEALELHKLMTYINNNGGVATQVKTDCVNYIANEPIDLSQFYWDKNKTVQKYRTEKAKPILRETNIDNTEEFKIQPMEYEDILCGDKSLVDTIINSNQGLLLLGMAGCGKTYLTNQIIKKLEEMDKRIIKLATTNKASLYIKGMTLDKFSHSIFNGSKQLNKFNSVDFIVVDEVSMMKEVFYQVLLSIKK